LFESAFLEPSLHLLSALEVAEQAFALRPQGVPLGKEVFQFIPALLDLLPERSHILPELTLVLTGPVAQLALLLIELLLSVKNGSINLERQVK